MDGLSTRTALVIVAVAAVVMVAWLLLVGHNGVGAGIWHALGRAVPTG